MPELIILLVLNPDAVITVYQAAITVTVINVPGVTVLTEKLQEAVIVPHIRKASHPDLPQRAAIAQRRQLPVAVARNTAPGANPPDIKRRHTVAHQKKAGLIHTTFIVIKTPRASQMISGRNSTTTKMTMMMRTRPTTQQRTTGTIIIEGIIKEGIIGEYYVGCNNVKINRGKMTISADNCV